MKIVVVGAGYVGLIAGVCFAEAGHIVTCVDIDSTKIDMINSGRSPVYERDLEELMVRNMKQGRFTATTDDKKAYQNAEVIFIGVNTPQLPDGSADLSSLCAVLAKIAQTAERNCLIVIKSTVPVGTGDMAEQFIKECRTKDVSLTVASNPEFLSQGTGIRDTFHASRIILGTENEDEEELLRKIYAPFDLPIVSVSRKSAEMIKYASNCFLALKISYMNDIANLCELFGADIEDVAEGMSYDKRIGGSYLNAGIGYGGSCLPKDTKAMVRMAKQKGYILKTVDAAVKINEVQKTKLYEKARKRFITLKNRKAAVLGLAFKPGTDDLRDAPSIDNIMLLSGLGADIHAYDPAAGDNFKLHFPLGITCTITPEEALTDADVCFIFTEWEEIRNITPEQYKKLMRNPVVYDGRNIYNPEQMKSAGVEYYSIGR